MIVPEFPPFRPHPAVRGGHWQTILGSYWPTGKIVHTAQLHQLKLSDGDQLCLHDDCPTDWSAGDRVAVMIHGLGGCHGSNYMVAISHALANAGVRVFRIDLRGWGAGAAVAKLPFHAARTSDLVEAISYVAGLSAGSAISVLGFSLGANLLLRMLGEQAKNANPQVDSALAVAPPIDLMRCCQDLGSGFGRVYDRKYATYLWNHLLSRQEIVPAFEAAANDRKPRRIYEFDQRFTAPLSGFATVEDYYAAASSIDLLEKVRTPTLILAAADDPIIPIDIFTQAKFSDAVQLRITDHGGHLGYIGFRNGDPTRRWLYWRCVQWVLAQATNQR